MKNDDKLKNIKEALLAVMREPHRWLLLVGTGESVAMETKLGMPALARHLLAAIPKNTAGWRWYTFDSIHLSTIRTIAA